MNTPKRKYPHKDVDMLTASAVLIENTIANKTFLQTKRSNWTDDFLVNLQTKIRTTLEEHLGIDSAKELRQSSQVLQVIQKQSLKDLAEAKVQIIEDFKNDPTKQIEILTHLGFTTHYKEAQIGSQEALVQLLYRFKTNLSPELKQEITAQGTAPAILEQIISYADNLKNANISQETFKGTRKEITTATIAAFNEIYDSIISIGKISSNFYKEEPAKKDLFNFTKIIKSLGSQKKSYKSK